jgi:hypothetical protein
MELLLSQESMSRSNSEFMSHHDLPTTGHFHSAIAFGPASVISIDMTGQCASRRSPLNGTDVALARGPRRSAVYGAFRSLWREMSQSEEANRWAGGVLQQRSTLALCLGTDPGAGTHWQVSRLDSSHRGDEAMRTLGLLTAVGGALVTATLALAQAPVPTPPSAAPPQAPECQRGATPTLGETTGSATLSDRLSGLAPFSWTVESLGSGYLF